MMQIARLVVLSVLTTGASTGAAQPWNFDDALYVTRTQGEGIFHHLESSGRRNIAVSGGAVGVAWEDDHDGTPRVYLAQKAFDSESFEAAVRISGVGEAYEPSLAALNSNGFFAAWEEDGYIHARPIAGRQLGPVTRLGASEATQASVSVRGNRVYVLRSERDGRFSRIRLQVLRLDDTLALASEADCAVDSAPLEDDQFYPASAIAGDELIAAWEDRRPGHTIIMVSSAKLDDVCTFTSPVRISGRRAGEESQYGKGHGVARPALGAFGSSEVLAVWADKRKYWEGYDIYAAGYLGNGRFGPNTKVQDEFGDFARQWHAAVAGDINGRVAVAWDDEREENSDIMLSWREDGGWSEDLPLPDASGDGQQAHPSIVMDAEGNLHVAWVERAEKDGPTRLRYQFGRLAGE
jgi:hypothetical protein